MHDRDSTTHPHSAESRPETRGRTIAWADRYDLVLRVLTLGQDRRLRRATVELANIAPGDAVLDIGCGTGDLTLAAKGRAGAKGRVCGVDASPEMIQAARGKAARAGYDVEFRLEPVEKLTLPDRSFDVVVSSLMMHHLPEELKREGLTEVHRVLKPGGRLIVVDFDRPKGIAGHVVAHLMLHGGMRFGVQDVAPLAHAVGFTGIESGHTPFPLIGYIRAAREG